MNHLESDRPLSRKDQRRGPTRHRHGWARKEDLKQTTALQTDGPFKARRSTGLTILILLTLSVLTIAGFAKVRSQNIRLEMAKDITRLTETRNRLLEKKRVLEKMQASFRHPQNIAKQARERLGMFELPPQRIKQFDKVPLHGSKEVSQ